MRARPRTLQRARGLRRAMTKPEVILWTHLRGDRLEDFRFRRQHPYGAYILDFYCAPLKLCVEIDGLVHGSAEAGRHDDKRTSWLVSQGISVVRFAASDVLSSQGLIDVLASIESLMPPPPLRGPPPP